MKASLSPERWAQVQRLFDEVVDLEPAARAVRLDEACRDDPDLREEVESLLAAYAQADDLLRSLDQLAPARPATSIPSRTGLRVSHYEVLEKLGGGGMGVVYKARDTKLDRFVALKFLPPQFSANAEAKRRFTQEAKAASALDHTNICTIHEIGETDDGQFFIAMAYYDGQTLKKKIKQGPLPLDEALDIAVQMARGLEKAHEKGIVHRDIKPANVMVTDDGGVKIVDFGLAKIADVQITKTGTTMGTVAYMSPEQARGEKVDHRTDVWSLGVVLYEMFTGERPFLGDYDQAIIYSLMHEDPTPAHECNPELPEELEHVVAMCLEKDPAQRYPTMADLLADLEVFTQGTGTSLHTTLRAIRRRRNKVRRSVLAGIGVLAALLLLLVIPSVRQAVLPGPGRLDLAVLPFDTPRGDSTQSLDGLVYMVTNTLTEMEQFEGKLSVIPPRDVLLAGDLSTSAAVEQFKVNRVITGTYQRIEDRVTLTLALINENGKQIRSRPLEVPLTHRAVVQKLAELLNIALDPATEEMLAAGGTTIERAFDYYTRGLAFLQRYEEEDNVEAAIVLFELATREDPAYAKAHAALGEAYWRKYRASGDTLQIDKAIAQGERAVALDDRLAAVHVTMGRIYRGTGHPQQAEQALLHALDLDPGNAFAHQQLGLTYHFLGKIDLAEKHARQAIDLKPDYWDFYRILGWLYDRWDRHQEAAEQYEQVVNLRPDNPMGYNDLAVQYQHMGRDEDAISFYQKATQVNPKATGPIALAYLNLALIDYSRKRFNEATRMCEKARDLEPMNAMHRSYLARSYYWDGQQEEAFEAWRRMIELDEANLEINPYDDEALARLAEAYEKMDAPEKTRLMLDRLAALPQRRTETLFSMAKTYEHLGERATALSLLEEALKNGLTSARIKVEGAAGLDALQADPLYQTLIARHTHETKEDDE